MIFGYFTLFVALIISAVAEFYSIVGLTSIFSAAFWPVVIMGAALGVGKVTAAVWLKLNWHRASLTYKLYLIPALIFLMLLTSMGIFGFLSKAHSDQSLVGGDVQSKIAIYDEKIKTEKENIEANRKALKQMDEGVDQVLGRSTDEKGADKAVALRRAQQKERVRLQNEISQSQKSIAELNDARAPIAAEVRKVEAEVGPIKYIAAFVYGNNPDANVLEKAVTWVIILIVAVFDPLALVLILAAQQTIKWERLTREDRSAMGVVPPDVVTRPFTPEEIAASDQYETDEEAYKRIEQELAETMQDLGIVAEPKYEPDNGALTNNQVDQIKKTIAEQYPYLDQPFVHFKNTKPMVYKPAETVAPPAPANINDFVPQPAEYIPDEDPVPCHKCGTDLLNTPGIGLFCPNKACDVLDGTFWDDQLELDLTQPLLSEYRTYTEHIRKEESEQPETVAQILPELAPIAVSSEIDESSDDDEMAAMDSVEKAAARKWKADNPGHTLKFQRRLVAAGKLTQLPWAVEGYNPNLVPDIDQGNETQSGFGIVFPVAPNKGDSFLRVDRLPSLLYKFNGSSWIEVDKVLNDRYAYDEAYIDHLISKIDTGEYDPELLSDAERDQIERRLTGN
jgi:hypothetical protein